MLSRITQISPVAIGLPDGTYTAAREQELAPLDENVTGSTISNALQVNTLTRLIQVVYGTDVLGTPQVKSSPTSLVVWA